MNRSALKRKGPIFWFLIVMVSFLVLFPLYWILVTSLKSPLENIATIPSFFPKIITLDNYTAILSAGFFKNLVNSLIVAGGATTISLVFSFLAAYALVRYKFPFKLNYIFLIWVLVVKILPPMVLSIPLYTFFAKVHLINNLLGLILVYQVYTLPYCIWI